MRDLSFGTTFAVLSLDRRNDNSRRRTEFLGLILVVGHELAHANLDHLNKRRANAVIGWIGGVAADAGIMLGGMSTYGALSRVLTQAGARAFSVAFEREADYVGAYYAARAGYDLTGSEEIWRTFALEDPESIRITTDHPITPLRLSRCRRPSMRSKTRSATICRWIRSDVSSEAILMGRKPQTKSSPEWQPGHY